MYLRKRGTPGKAPKHVRAWSLEEDNLLISLYPKFTIEEVALQMGRPIGGVNRRISILRKSNPGLLAKKKPFTEAEENLIRQNCKTMTVCQVATLLGRQPGDITQKALRMGVSFFKCGDMHHSTRISDADVTLIRALRDDDKGRQMFFREIAEKFEITPRQAWRAYNERLVATDIVGRELLPR